MGQKVHPTGFRLGITTDWTSKWYAERSNFSKTLHTDIETRNYLRNRLAQASVSRIQIERPSNSAFIVIHTGASRYCDRQERKRHRKFKVSGCSSDAFE